MPQLPAMFCLQRLLFALSILALVGIGIPSRACSAGEPDAPPAPVDFARDIRPIFVAHCHKCHGADKQEGGLRLVGREVAMAGGDSGEKAIVPGDTGASHLFKAISGADPDFKMPPEDEGKPLSAEQIELIARWIREGAVWPADADGTATKPGHWAWQKPAKAALPIVKHADWPRHPIDTFVLDEMEQAGFSPAPEADRYTLVRRVYLDLTGLPPTPEQVDAFVNDKHPSAYERMVDRALADPAYGERWARVWLDLARYADSKGYGSDPLRTIWRYRDWVIEAFNRNLPFDRFTIEQLAGDLLEEPTADQLLATAFHRNTMANDEGGTDDEEFRVAAVKDRIETTMQVWMGLTFGCAKCHSHKFDPITQREYYQAYAIFDQTEDADRGDEAPVLPTPTRWEAAQLTQLHAKIAFLEQQIATPPSGIDGEVARWEQLVKDQNAKWTMLPPREITSTAGAKFESQSDGSILVSGATVDSDTYDITIDTDLTGITALRLEAIPHESLPQGGPGRAANGNFVLSEVAVTAVRNSPAPVAGRFVRIELAGEKRILSLAEVQVFEDDSNIAPTGKATQSSTFFQAPAELAIDSKTDGDFDHKSVTHTAEESNPWWEVDLGRTAAISHVAVWNRIDHDLVSRLSGFRLLVLDEDRKPMWQAKFADAAKPNLDVLLTGPMQIEVAEATADFAQDGFAPAMAVDGDATTGWAVSPQLGKPHYAVFTFKQPLPFAGPSTLSIKLTQSHGAAHTLGHFRVSAISEPSPPKALRQSIHDILAIDAAARSADQRAALLQYYWSIAPATDALRAQVNQLRAEIAQIEKGIATTPILRELASDKRRVTHMMLKGNFRQPGDAVEPGLPAAFPPLPEGAALSRLGLAQWLVDRDNPLTARVAVNRLWAQLFGVGLVATEEDFGTQGLPPTHPEVLDWLAVEFHQNGWDTKDILRQIVSSATYRQSSTPTAGALEKDPLNRHLARGPRFRLEAEMIRDQALATSGLLSRKQGGPSVYPPQPPNLWRAAFNGQRTWATSSGEDRHRRGLYTYWRRTVPYPSMAAFDAPSREICTMRRISTNTPLQAFVTLNDPVFVEAAQALARRIVAEGGGSVEERGRFALRLALARPPDKKQVDQLAALFRETLTHYQKDAEAATAMATDPLGPLPAGYNTPELAAWTVVSNVVLNLDGVLTKR